MDEFALSFWVSAVLTGLAFGYVIQRGGFCLTRAISNLALMGDAGIMRSSPGWASWKCPSVPSAGSPISWGGSSSEWG